MKLNDSGDFCMLYIEPADEKAAVFEVIGGQKKPVVIMLPVQTRSRMFQRPEDFNELKHVKRQHSVVIIFVITGNELLRQLAARIGFPAYASIDGLSEALLQGQLSLSRQRTLARTTPLASPGPVISTRKTVPLMPETLPQGMGVINHKQASTVSLAQQNRSTGAIKRSPTTGAINRTPTAGAINRVPTIPSPPQVPSSPSLPHHPARKRRGGFPLALLILSLLIMSGVGGAGAYFYLSHQPSTPAVTTGQVVGHLYFLSSQQVSESSDQGLNDEVQLDLHSIPVPAPGKSYYAWLLSDKNQGEATIVLLGKLSIDHGNVHLLYTGDQQHTNLLAITSRFLITEEDALTTPITPSPDYSDWRYYAEFPQSPDPTDMHHYSFLDHLRHLLAADPMLDDMEIPGGLGNWFYRNTGKLLEWTVSARDRWEETKDLAFIRQQAILILAYLDGLAFFQHDLPPNIPLPSISRFASIGLLDVKGADQNPPSYLYSLVYHLNGLIYAPGAPAELRKEAAQLIAALSNARQWLEKLRDDARKIITMTDAQLAQPGGLALLNDMLDQANLAYAGEIDPTTGERREGVIWIHERLQSLAMLDVAQYIRDRQSPEIIPDVTPVTVMRATY